MATRGMIIETCHKAGAQIRNDKTMSPARASTSEASIRLRTSNRLATQIEDWNVFAMVEIRNDPATPRNTYFAACSCPAGILKNLGRKELNTYANAKSAAAMAVPTTKKVLKWRFAFSTSLRARSIVMYRATVA